MWMELRHGGTRGGVWYVYVVVWDETESRRRQGRGGLGSRYNNPFNVYSSPLERETARERLTERPESESVPVPVRNTVHYGTG